MTNSMILPVTYPIITSRSHYTNYISIFRNTDYAKNWIFNNFILLEIQEKNDEIKLKYEDWDCSEYKQITTKNLNTNDIKSNGESILEFCKKWICNEYYVSLHLDGFYFSNSIIYKKYHHPHPVLIYGFNDDTKLFNIANYYMDQLKYHFNIVSFKELNDAFEMADYKPDPFKKHPHITDVILTHWNEEIVYVNLNLSVIIEKIKVYLKPKNETRGINVYNLLSDHIIKLGEIKSIKEPDIHVFQLLYEHKNLMYLRLKYIENKYQINLYDIINKYFEMSDKALILRNILLKSIFTRKKLEINKCIEILSSILKLEIDSLSELLLRFDNIVLPIDTGCQG